MGPHAQRDRHSQHKEPKAELRDLDGHDSGHFAFHPPHFVLAIELAVKRETDFPASTW